VADGLEHYRTSLVAVDRAIEALELFHMIYRNADFFHFEGSRVANHATIDLGFRVVAAKAVIGIDGGRRVIDFVARGNRDLKRVGVVRRSFKLYGEPCGSLVSRKS
jgi:hypothetical protein